MTRLNATISTPSVFLIDAQNPSMKPQKVRMSATLEQLKTKAKGALKLGEFISEKSICFR